MRQATLASLLAVLAVCAAAQPNRPAPIPTIAERTQGLQAKPGLLPLYWDGRQGKLYLEVPEPGREMIHVVSLPAGVGSNDIGLDRGQLGGTRLVRFERSGPKVLLVQPNTRFRATTDNPDERRAVTEAFAQSVLAGFAVEAEQDGRVLVDATSFFLQDVHGVSGALQRTRQGTYRVDAARSTILPDRTRAFPKNSEIDVLLTFAGEQPGSFVREVVPTPEAITVRQHHSFVALPEPGFQPRRFDPRAGYGEVEYLDYATPFDQPVAQRLIRRHRLAKKDPGAAVSEAVQPIRYYLDRGAPEPIRTALLEGARWWSQAFEAAGYRNAFTVELLPEDADPMDVRYNMIQWVHRSTRGWSYGASITDPRTGEILKGQVTLGSLRVRQDYLIAEGLLAPYENGQAAPPALREMALARLRQLSAHEVGHTLGLAHAYAASVRDRSSVMDYPHPLVGLGPGGVPDLSRAYATGIGDWDKVAIAYGYQQFAPGTNERAALNGILNDALRRGLMFLSDQDARPAGSAHPDAHLWDNGRNAIDELERVLAVRRQALERFGERNIREGAPLATLEEALVPLYYGHRYQVEAAAKILGGLRYTYALRGDGQLPTAVVPPGEQSRALEGLLTTLQPSTLLLPERIVSLIPPRPMGYERTRETFRSRTGLTFDCVTAAEAAADLTVALLLQPERAGRLVEQGARAPKNLGLTQVVDRLVAATWKREREAGLAGEIQRRVDTVVLTHVMRLAAQDAAAPQARGVALMKLEELKAWVETQAKVTADAAQKAHWRLASRGIGRFLEDPKAVPLPPVVEAPPGQPIGCE